MILKKCIFAHFWLNWAVDSNRLDWYYFCRHYLKLSKLKWRERSSLKKQNRDLKISELSFRSLLWWLLPKRYDLSTIELYLFLSKITCWNSTCKWQWMSCRLIPETNFILNIYIDIYEKNVHLKIWSRVQIWEIILHFSIIKLSLPKWFFSGTVSRHLPKNQHLWFGF